MTVFAAYSAYYDLLNADKDYAAEAEYVSKLFGAARSVLELGCGTGKHAELLARRGFEVHGVDRSETMLNAARERVLDGLSFAHGDATSYRAGRTFDAVISLFHVVSYQTAQRDLEAMLATARAHLDAGGLFVFDVWYGPSVLTVRPERRVKQLANDAIEVTRRAEPALHANENVVDVHYEVAVREKATGHVETIRETHRMRYLFAPELEVLLRHAGFRLERFEEWLTAKPAGFDTWSVCFIARAVNHG